MLRCADVQNELKAYVDGELGRLARRRISKHVASCAACKSELDAMRSLSVAIQRADVAEPPASLRNRILDSLPPVEPAAPPAWYRRRAQVLALAGAASVAFAAGILWHAAPRAHLAMQEDVHARSASATSAPAKRVAQMPTTPVPSESFSSQTPSITLPKHAAGSPRKATSAPTALVEPKQQRAMPAVASPSLAAAPTTKSGPIRASEFGGQRTMAGSNVQESGHGGFGGGAGGTTDITVGGGYSPKPEAIAKAVDIGRRRSPSPGGATGYAVGARRIRLDVDDVEGARKRLIEIARTFGGQATTAMGRNAAGSVSIEVPAGRADALVSEIRAGLAPRQQQTSLDILQTNQAANNDTENRAPAALGKNAQPDRNVATPGADAVNQQNQRTTYQQQRNTAQVNANVRRAAVAKASQRTTRRQMSSANTAGNRNVQQATSSNQMVVVVVELVTPQQRPAAAKQRR